MTWTYNRSLKILIKVI